MAYNLLRREIREYVYDQGWPALRKIQEASIKQTVNTDNNLILAAPTASGKTEAAFLPAINNIEDWSKGLKVIYISPLIALINDQFKRMTELCAYLDIPVTSWHGEASQKDKQNLLQHPKGVLLITPESLEAMFSVRADKMKKLFEDVEWIIIDEIHSFLDNNRGLHLQSLLERITMLTKVNPRLVGMSATLNKEDYSVAKDFFKNERVTNVLLDSSSNSLEKTISYYPQDNGTSQEAIREIFDYSQKESMLIFPNSRAEVETIASKLTELSKKEQTYSRYFAHHSAVSREMRTMVENFAKNSNKELFAICCTSTLELGIDIGAVDSVVQYNAPYSVASLSQRLGRSGRKIRKSILHFIATNPWSLLQGLAAIEMYENKIIDRVVPIAKPYDVLAHQIISIVLANSGIPLDMLYKINKTHLTWNSINNKEVEDLVNYLIKANYLEIVENEVITGKKVEPLLFAGNFFAHFATEEQISVFEGSKKIGVLPLASNLGVDSEIILSASSWRIVSIDYSSLSMQVVKSAGGEVPNFLSTGGNVTTELRNQMKNTLLNSRDKYDENINACLENLLASLIIKDNFVWIEEDNLLVTFQGTKVNTTLQLALNTLGHDKYVLNERESVIGGENLQYSLSLLNEEFNEDKIQAYLANNSDIVETFTSNLKYKDLLPYNLKVAYIMNNILDILGTKVFLSELFDNENLT